MKILFKMLKNKIKKSKMKIQKINSKLNQKFIT